MILGILRVNCQSLTPQWALQIGGIGDDRGIKVISDLNGNIYFAGIFEKKAIVSINGIKDTIQSKGYEDVYFGKVNPDGQLLWSQRIGGKGSDSPTDLMIDRSGHVYLSGIFQDSCFFQSDTLVCSDYIDSFITKFDSLGNVLWIRQISGEGNQQCRAMMSDINGSLITGGFFTKTLEFPTTQSTVYQSQGGYDGFVAKWTPQGQLDWVNTVPNSGDVILKDVMTDSQGDCYTVGNFTDSISLDNDQSQIRSVGKTDVFLIKYNEEGDLEWAESFGGIFDDNAKCITAGGNSKMVVVGEFKEDLLCDENVILTAQGGDDIFYLTFNKHGKLQHQKKHGLEKNDFVFDAWIPVGQKILMASDLRINQENKNTILADYGLLGDMSDLYLTGDDLNPTVLSGVMTTNDQIYFCGNFHGTAIFNQLNLVSYGSEDFFLIKLGSDYKNEAVDQPDSNEVIQIASKTPSPQSFGNISLLNTNDSVNTLFIYPNPFREETHIIYNISETCDIVINILDVKGNILKEWDLPNQSPGTYVENYITVGLSEGVYECIFQAQGKTVFISKYLKLIHVK